MDKFPKRYWLTLAWTWQVDLILWFLTAAIFRPFLGCNLHWEGLVLQCEKRKAGSLIKIGVIEALGMNLGHVCLYAHGRTQSPGLDTILEQHEHGHAEQWEGNMLFCTVVAISIALMSASNGLFYAFLPVIIPIWLLGGYAIYFARGLQAWIRGESIYHGNTDEESMYAQFPKQ